MRLHEYIPDFNLNGTVFAAIFNSRQAKIDIFYDNINDLVKQCHISTATWGIVYWEQSLGLNVDETDTIENRRSRCLAQIRSTGNCTIEHIKYVANSFGYGDIDVIEDYEHYKVTIKFISDIGIPPKLDDFKRTMRLIIPAHLNILYEFKYNTWNDVKQACIDYGYTWGYFKEHGVTWEDLRTKDLSQL